MKKILFIIFCILLLSVPKIEAAGPVYAPSIFADNYLESQIRTLVENLLFIKVSNDIIENREDNQAIIDYLQKKQDYSQELLNEKYQKLYSYYHSSESNEAEIQRIFEGKRKEHGFDNEFRLFNYLINQFESGVEKLTLDFKILELDKQEPNYKFYLSLASELTRLIKIFPTYPNQIRNLNDSEHLGFSLNERELVLTFDDGPTNVTPKLLDILAEQEIKASFFLLGMRFIDDDFSINDEAKETIMRMKELGMDIGLHSFTHDNLVELNQAEDFKYQLKKPKKLLESELGIETKLFRAPYGSRNAEVLAEINKYYDYHILWNIDSQDWNQDFDSKVIKERIIRLAHFYNGGIVLAHDTNYKLAETLEELIIRLEKNSFSFHSLEETIK